MRKFENSVSTKSGQTRILHRKKGYTYPTLCNLVQLNLIIERYSHQFAIISQNEKVSKFNYT